MDNISSLPLIEKAAAHNSHLAIVDGQARYTYGDLLQASEKIASCLLTGRSDLDLRQARVAFMVPPSFEYVAAQWGIWRAGGVGVPLSPSHPPAEIEYMLGDAAPEIMVAHPVCEKKLRPILSRYNARFLLISEAASAIEQSLPNVHLDRRAMILYTSGTSSRPKGVVTTHRNITAQITTLIDAWEWTANDHILNVLPLHHVHGIVNVLLCPLWVGATCEILPKFDADEVWDRFVSGQVTLFMAVPTIYVKLIEAWEKATREEQEGMSKGCANLRVMISGSAPLPVSVLEKWKKISGHILLERYGMTEIGMALSNPLHGERRAGFVGVPLPGVKVRMVDESGREIKEEGNPGEIQVKGSIVFLEYWGRPEATGNAFRDGWFCTGDLAVIEEGYFRILGRNSVDIIKTGGYKVSALEIEEVLRTHPAIIECAIVGVDDCRWGERVCAAVKAEANSSLSFDELRGWAKKRMANYKVPSRFLLVGELPRNAMGKVTKREVKRLFQKGREEGA